MITHINLDWTNNSLCGITPKSGSAWLTKKKKYEEIYPKTNWCKKCLYIYNVTRGKQNE